MSTHGGRILVLLCSLVALGCASPRPILGPLVNPSERLHHHGFSILPPQGENWHLVTNRPKRVTFGKGPVEAIEAQVKKELRTFWATAYVFDVSARFNYQEADLDTAAEFKEFVGLEWSNKPGDRVRVIGSKLVLDSSRGTDCVWTDIVAEERDNPMRPGVVFETTYHGLECRHPDSPLLVVVVLYSERYPQGGQARLIQAYKQELDPFIDSLMFRPVR